MSRTTRQLRRSDGTALNVTCDPWPPIHGFARTRPISEDDDEGIREDDYEPVLALLADCIAIPGRCKRYIVVITVRRNDQITDPTAIVEGETYPEMVAGLDNFPISHLAPRANPSQSSRLVRHFGESRDRFLVEALNPLFDMDLQDDGKSQDPDGQACATLFMTPRPTEAQAFHKQARPMA